MKCINMMGDLNEELGQVGLDPSKFVTEGGGLEHREVVQAALRWPRQFKEARVNSTLQKDF